jgi:hypothetical protein
MIKAINKFCPRSGEPVVDDSLTTYKDKVIGFCNPHCRDDFRDNIADRPKDTAYFDAVINETESKLDIVPSETSSSDDFDFLVGTWNVKNRKLTSRLSNSDEWTEFDAVLDMRKTLNGIGNFETFSAVIDGKTFAGEAVRLFDPATRLWSIYWADSNTGVLDKNPVIGSYENGLGKFYAKDFFNGKEIRVLYQWDKTDPKHPIWSQAFSANEGETWEWNWYMNLTKIAALAA